MNNNILLIFFLIGLLINTFQISAQRKKIDYSCDINQISRSGQKVGFWRQETDYHHKADEIYYEDGLKCRVYRVYSEKNNELQYFGVVSKDKETKVYDFSEYGHLLSCVKDFKKNTNPMIVDKILYAYPRNQCYITYYYPNGIIESEGVYVYFEDYSIDYYEYGEWKYYSDKGELVETKYFK